MILNLTPSVPLNTFNDTTCYSKGEIATITPSWVIDVGASASTISWTITDANDVAVVLPQYVFPLDTFTSAQRAITFTLSVIGTYTVTAVMENVDTGAKIMTTIYVKTCNFIDIVYTSCNKYSLYNRSTTIPINYTVVNSVAGSTVISNTVLGVESVTQLNLPNVSLYNVIVTYINGQGQAKTENYIISNHCALDNCLTKSILNSLCSDESPCSDDCKPSAELAELRIASLRQAYYFHLNKIFSVNNYFTSFDATLIERLTSAQDILLKLKEVCARTGCLDDGCGSDANSNLMNGGSCSCGAPAIAGFVTCGSCSSNITAGCGCN